MCSLPKNIRSKTFGKACTDKGPGGDDEWGFTKLVLQHVDN